MSITEVFAGVEQADVAAMTIGGRTYRCFVWGAGVNVAGPQRIEAGIFVDGEDGQRDLVDKAVVANAINDLVDCPRVLAVEASGVFVVHWIDVEYGDPGVVIGASLYRSIFDVAAIATGWSSQGSVALHVTLQYDHATIDGDADDEFVVSRRTAVGTIVTTRYSSPFSWLDVDWTDTRAGLTIAASVLACHANNTDNVVLISYQDTLLLRTIRIPASTGGGLLTTSETFADLVDGDMHFTAVSHVRIATDTYLVACEASPDDEQVAGRFYARLVGFRAITGATTAVLHESQWVYGWHLLSRLWTWASGVTGAVEAFALLGWKSIADGQEYDQMIGACVRFDVESLAGANAAGVLKPIPVAALTAGSLDTRPHGQSPYDGTLPSIGTRVNHLSHASGPPQYNLGPNKKCMTVATIRWQRLVIGNAADELQPAIATVGYYEHVHEDPWMVVQDTKEVALPDTPQWRGLANRPMALPVEVQPGLMFTGGVTACYDGEQLVELGFFHAPEITVSAVGAGGAMDDATTYYWYANYAWIDNRGNIHRGPPSRPVSVAVVVNGYATITCRCHTLGMKDDATRYPLASPISIEVWRTTAPGGTPETEDGLYLFRREFGSATTNYELRNTPVNDPNAFTVSIDVGRPNSEVSNNELSPFQLDLDTLQWTPPPPITHQPLAIGTVWQNRLFGVDPELGLLRWSEEILPLGAALVWPEFLDTNVFRLDTVGEATALQPMGDDLVIFSRDGIFTLSGDPGAGGSGNTFILRTVARGEGCCNPRSVTLTPMGVTFESHRGLKLLTRGYETEDIGAPVEELIRDAGAIRSVVHLPDRFQVRFGLQALPGTGPLAIRPRLATWHYRANLWSVRTFPMIATSSSASRLNEMQHATVWRGLGGEHLHVLLFEGGLARERSDDDTAFSDEGASSTDAVRLDVTTEWITMSLDSTKRFHEIGIQTERVNAGPLTVEAWFDHDGSFDSDDGAAQQTLTIASPAPPFIRFRPEQGKCRAIKLRIYEPASAPTTENLRLVALVVHWSIQPRRQGSRNNAAA